MKKYIQLFNLPFFITLYFTFEFIFGQARLHKPPTTPIKNGSKSFNLKFETNEILNPKIAFIHNSKNNALISYILKIQSDSEKELILEIDNAMQSSDDHYYIRYENGGYIGPIFSNELQLGNKLKINGINPDKFIIEYFYPLWWVIHRT